MNLTPLRARLGRLRVVQSLPALARKGIGVFRREGLRGVRNRLAWLWAGAPGAIGVREYAEWIARVETIDAPLRERIRERIAALPHAPRISVVMPVYNPKPEWLEAAVESVRAQLYPHWELCIADDLSPDPAVRAVLRERNGHISAASNSALEIATGDWVALLDHDDLLPEHALYSVADTIVRHPSVRMIYSDEDKIDASGQRCEPYFKTDWNPELFYSQNMFSHLGVFERRLLNEVGGFRAGFEGSQDYDLVLRCLEKVGPDAIRHIPRVLYHWRIHAASTASDVGAKPYTAVVGERALNEHFARRGVAAQAEYTGAGYRVRYGLPDPAPRVSLIIPTRDALALVRQCIDSIIGKTDYPDYEILIVDNGSVEPATLAYFRAVAADPRIRVLRDDGPFNYSALNNAAARQASGTLIGLLNNDLEVISPDWLTEMVGLALQPEVGCVGARLLYPDGTIQHAGLMLAGPHVAMHVHKLAPGELPGYFRRMHLSSAFSAVTAACALMRRAVFDEVGGLNERDLAVAYNDVDLCLKIREAGYRNVCTPYATLYHHESATRGKEDDPAKQARFEGERAYMLERWGEALDRDPYYNPNLTPVRCDFSLASVPRLEPLA